MLLVVVAALAACTTTPPPACIDAAVITATCASGMLYAPTFDNVYASTLAKNCTGTACHSPGTQGGFTFTDEASAYTALLAESQLDPPRDRVDPGNPACSLMIVRTDSPGTSYEMPPGNTLSDPEICSLIMWVQAGAGSGSN